MAPVKRGTTKLYHYDFQLNYHKVDFQDFPRHLKARIREIWYIGSQRGTVVRS